VYGATECVYLCVCVLTDVQKKKQTLGGVYGATECVIEKYRAKSDMKNAIYAGTNLKKRKVPIKKKKYRAKSDMNAIYIGTNFEKFVYAVILCGKYTSDFT